MYAKQVLDGRSGHWIASGRAIRQFLPAASRPLFAKRISWSWFIYGGKGHLRRRANVPHLRIRVRRFRHFSPGGGGVRRLLPLALLTIGLLTRNKDKSRISLFRGSAFGSVYALERRSGRRSGRQPEVWPVFPEGLSFCGFPFVSFAK
jgi:hypothetical protein